MRNVTAGETSSLYNYYAIQILVFFIVFTCTVLTSGLVVTANIFLSAENDNGKKIILYIGLKAYINFISMFGRFLRDANINKCNCW